jgi:hypothetical protein
MRSVPELFVIVAVNYRVTIITGNAYLTIL